MMNWSQLISMLETGRPVVYSFPEAFWLLAVIPFFIWIYQRQSNVSDWELLAKQKKHVFRHSLINQLHFSRQPTKKPFNLLQWGLHLLRYMILVLAVLALAKPVKELPLPPEPQTKTVRDIVFVIESSASMMLEDYEIDGQATARMEVVKSVLDQFVASLDGNRFSFVVYADKSYTLMPMTADTMTARLMLKRLKPYLAGREDAAFGEALGLALQQAEHSTKYNTENTQKRILVVFSDGENKPSHLPVAEAINYAQGLNLPIYTVGVGAGTAEADKREYSGLLYQTLQEQSLKEIAHETNGQYFQVGSRQAIQTVLAKIDQAEGAQIVTAQAKHKTVQLYPYLLAILMMVFILYFSLIQLFATRVNSHA
jgi:Ca-activated chloride channel family protein